MWLLARIGQAGSFVGISLHHVNAHGHAMMAGWLGLFTMGFSLQVFPRMWGARPVPRVPAMALLAGMVAGLIVQVTGMARAGSWGGAVPLVLAGGTLHMVAISVWCVLLSQAYRVRRVGLPHADVYLFTAMGWFVIQALMGLWHTLRTIQAESPADLLWVVATWQAPLRDLQVHGLALFMILGVSLRLLPAWFGAPATPIRRAWWGYGLLLAGVIGEVGLFLTYRHTGERRFAALLLLPWLSLASGAFLVAGPWRLWRPLPRGDRSAKFIRIAYVWLAGSLAMLLLIPVYRLVSGIPFSHAYYGAIRHAITVGFVSMTILGMSARAALEFRPPTRPPSPLWIPFLLINLGCLLRVTLQVASDFHLAAFALAPVSGILEVAALAGWAAMLVRDLGWSGVRTPAIIP